MASAMLRHLLMTFFLISCVAAAEVRRELTTRSWDAIGFHEDAKRSPVEDSIIIGVVDSGISPESESFSDVGFGPPPQKWKGICQTNSFNFKCNNKIIGARFYIPDAKKYPLDTEIDEVSPRDNDGHGTHVAATVAGVPVKGVSVNGLGLGTARGAVPRARIAVYKTCWNSNDGQCFNVENAIADAVADGVDIITLSLGGAFSRPFNKDKTSIAAFDAMRHGVMVSFAAGNSGEKPFLIDNVAPWMLTVGNSFTSPEYATFIKLGNGKIIKGQQEVQTGHTTQYPLVKSSDVSAEWGGMKMGGQICKAEFLDNKLTQGKIVLCPFIMQADFQGSTAAGIIYDAGDNYEMLRTKYGDHGPRPVPLVAVTSEDFKYLLSYYNQKGTASIMKTEEIKSDSPPFVASSSSRGPSIADPTIMKPDICAPGVNIIAATIGNSSSFDSFTGTSMAAPHATGIAAYVKSFHSEWSPAAIKSALITTATPMVKDPNNHVAELAYGAGNLNPLAAVDPGLVYDIELNDYIKYVCKYSKNDAAISHTITADPNLNCANITIEENWSLNLPTFSIPAKPNTPFVKVFRRSVKNVGPPVSNYKAVVSAPAGLEVVVQPSILSFEKADQVLFYDVTIKGQIADNSVLSASFVWTDGPHNVRSPIVIFPEFDQKAVWKRLIDEFKAGTLSGRHLV